MEFLRALKAIKPTYQLLMRTEQLLAWLFQFSDATWFIKQLCCLSSRLPTRLLGTQSNQTGHWQYRRHFIYRYLLPESIRPILMHVARLHDPVWTQANSGQCWAGPLHSAELAHFTCQCEHSIRSTSSELQVGQDHVTSGLQILTGYPRHSLYKRLSLSISYWMVTG